MHWEADVEPGFRASDRWPSKEAMFEELLVGTLEEVKNRAPDVVVCDAEMQRAFVEEREKRKHLYLRPNRLVLQGKLRHG